jgi:hypothetical protein
MNITPEYKKYPLETEPKDSPALFKKFNLKADVPSAPLFYPISAQVIADSYYIGLGEGGVHRATTLELEFPRYILAELNTHRAFSKNASSSRAIPTLKQIKAVQESPVLPVRWGKNQPGMQASKENLSPEDEFRAKEIWLSMVDFVAEKCAELVKLGLHKQWASRPLEWASTIKVVLTGVDFDNFFLLRDHGDAQDEMILLAQAIKRALNKSTPVRLDYGQWHLPYVSLEDLLSLGLKDAMMVSAARCARVSYKTHHGIISSLEDDKDLFGKLTHGMVPGVIDEENPFHASPTEHQLAPLIGGNTSMSGNAQGWMQFRKFIESGIPPV